MAQLMDRLIEWFGRMFDHHYAVTMIVMATLWVALTLSVVHLVRLLVLALMGVDL